MSDTSNDIPLLSIVVPTRNRQDCALSLARSLHASTESSFELVLHDNSDDDSLGRAIADLGDARLRYIHSSEKLNMHENFSRAIANARGAYLCGLGDDDGILVEPALRIVEQAQVEGVDAVLTAIRSFLWPGLRHWLWGDLGGKIFPTHRHFSTSRQLDPVAQAVDVFSDATVNGLRRLPRLYHGIVSRAALDRLRERSGSYFPGGSPDMANAMGLAYCTNALTYDPRAAVISGHSRKSGGGTGAAGQHHGRIEDQPHLPPGILDRWPAEIPRYWSGHTIYAQSAIAAAEDVAAGPLPPFAFHRLYAACFIFDRKEYRGDVIAAMRGNPAFGPALVARTAVSAAAMFAIRVRAFVGSIWRYRIARSGQRAFSDMEDFISDLSARRDW